MEKIGEGETSEVFRIGDGKVVKLFKPEFFEESSFENEYSIAKYIGDNSDLAPKVHGQTSIMERSGYIMDEVDGELFQDVIDNNPDRLKTYAALFGRHHARLHSIADFGDLVCLGKMKEMSPGFLNSNGNFPAKVDSWLKEIVGSLSDELVIGHSDYMPYNLFLSGDKLLAVDWAEAGMGPAASTVARTINFISDPTDYPRSEYTVHSGLFIREYLAAYSEIKEINLEELDKCLLLNAACEYNWAVYSNQVDAFSLQQKEFVLANYNSVGSVRLIEF